jgi:malonyl-CoA/methylmalonyl-CoA synthetase
VLSLRPVPILATPSPRWLPGFLRVVAAGGVAAPLSAAYPPAELAWFADDLGADTIVVSDDLAAQAAAMAAGRRVVRIESLGDDGDGARDVGAALAGDAAAPTLVLYTSGTTGRPKGAILSRGNLEEQTRVLAEAWGVTAADRMVHALPLHHLHGLVVGLLTAARAGARVELLPRFDAARVVERLVATDATLWMAVPTMYHRLRELAERDAAAARALAAAAARLRLATSGSAALPVGLAAWWKTVHGAIPLERFGMTEVGIALSNPLARDARRAGTVGTPLPGVEIRIAHDDGALGDGPGELQVRGASVFLGYHARAEADAAAFGADGWFLTGDRAERDADGYVRLLGRTSVDILKSAGYKISALEIEECLREHPDVADAAVVGLPDEALGDRLVAAIVPRAGAAASPDALLGYCRERLARYKVPRAVVVLDELPRNPMGKVMKRELAVRLRGS